MQAPVRKNSGSIITIRPRLKKWQSRQERSKQLPAPPPISFPLLPPSSLLHTLFITADFPLAIAIVSNPPTHPLTHTHTHTIHRRAGVCPQHGSVTSRAFTPLVVARCLSNGNRATEFLYFNVFTSSKRDFNKQAINGRGGHVLLLNGERNDR